jgi:hypothetical protein
VAGNVGANSNQISGTTDERQWAAHCGSDPRRIKANPDGGRYGTCGVQAHAGNFARRPPILLGGLRHRMSGSPSTESDFEAIRYPDDMFDFKL